jgi:hypothetical protein
MSAGLATSSSSAPARAGHPSTTTAGSHGFSQYCRGTRRLNLDRRARCGTFQLAYVGFRFLISPRSKYRPKLFGSACVLRTVEDRPCSSALTSTFLELLRSFAKERSRRKFGFLSAPMVIDVTLRAHSRCDEPWSVAFPGRNCRVRIGRRLRLGQQLEFSRPSTESPRRYPAHFRSRRGMIPLTRYSVSVIVAVAWERTGEVAAQREAQAVADEVLAWCVSRRAVPAPLIAVGRTGFCQAGERSKAQKETARVNAKNRRYPLP